MATLYPTQTSRLGALHATRCAKWCVLLCVVVSVLIVLAGCQSSPDKKKDVDIPLPGFGDERPTRPTGVYAVIRRADVPLEESTDDAWAIINEQVVAPMTRGAWRGNGMRIGLLPKDQLDAYSKAMPQPVGFSRLVMNKSSHPVPILESPRLRSDIQFQMDLTRLPKPRQVETVKGGENSTLRLLARIETDEEGRHSLVLTPHHYIPSPLNLIPREPLEKELDGRIFEELTIRLTPGDDQIAVVGLHWPWPLAEVLPGEQPTYATSEALPSLSRDRPLPASDPADPAAPPPHITPAELQPDDESVPDKPDKSDSADDIEHDETQPRYERAAPPLPTSFGSTLLTGTRIRQPIRSILLITIEDPTKSDAANPMIESIE